MKISVRRRTQNQILIWVLFLGAFLIAPLTQLFKVPGAIKYILDIAWCLLLLIMLTRNKRFIDKQVQSLQKWIFLFFIFTIINYFANYQSIFYYLWGFRNNFRGYVLFFAVIYYFRDRDIYEAFNLLDKLFYFNLIIMFIQFTMGYKQDNLGGIFGVESGCNAYINIYFCIMTTLSFVLYMEGKKNLKELVIQILFMLILAAMSELKFFYVEFIIIIVISSIITQFSWKKIAIITVAIAAVIIGYKVFVGVFPDIDLSVSGLYEYASSDKGYTSSGDLNRFHFLETINNNFLKGNIRPLFGLGLGNCDYATGMEIVTSPFSRLYGYLHYGWMSTTFMYLENGWIGLIFYFGFFVQASIRAITQLKYHNKMFCKIAFMCGIIAVLNSFYNISLRLESCYMLYFMMAIPWCQAERKNEK